MAKEVLDSFVLDLPGRVGGPGFSFAAFQEIPPWRTADVTRGRQDREFVIAVRGSGGNCAAPSRHTRGLLTRVDGRAIY